MLVIDPSEMFKIRNSFRDDLLSARREVAEAWRALQSTLIDSRALMMEADRIMDRPTRSPTSMLKPTWHHRSNWGARADELRRMAKDMTEIAAQTIMLRIAADYDRLVENAESR
jgi:hypothetical protein